MSRFDAFDHSFIIHSEANSDQIACGDNAPLVGDEALEQAANGTAIFLPIIRLNDAEQTVDAQHAAMQAVAQIGGRSRVGGVISFFRWRRIAVLSDGSFARQIALGPNAFVGPRRLVLETMVLEIAGPGILARRLRQILAKFDADLFLFRHNVLNRLRIPRVPIHAFRIAVTAHRINATTIRDNVDE